MANFKVIIIILLTISANAYANTIDCDKYVNHSLYRDNQLGVLNDIKNQSIEINDYLLEKALHNSKGDRNLRNDINSLKLKLNLLLIGNEECNIKRLTNFETMSSVKNILDKIIENLNFIENRTKILKLQNQYLSSLNKHNAEMEDKLNKLLTLANNNNHDNYLVIVKIYNVYHTFMLDAELSQQLGVGNKEAIYHADKMGRQAATFLGYSYALLNGNQRFGIVKLKNKKLIHAVEGIRNLFNNDMKKPISGLLDITPAYFQIKKKLKELQRMNLLLSQNIDNYIIK